MRHSFDIHTYIEYLFWEYYGLSFIGKYEVKYGVKSEVTKEGQR
jgi:hypothetical protein